MLYGYGQHHGVVEHVGHVQEIVAVGDFKQGVAVVVVVVAVFHGDFITSVYRHVQVVETTIAQQEHLARNDKGQGIHIAVVVYREAHVYVGVAHIGVFHIGEKLLVKMIVETVCALCQALERQFECGKLSHNGVG